MIDIEGISRFKKVAITNGNILKTDVYGEKQLLFYTLMLKIADRSCTNFQLIIKIYNDLLIIYLAYCLVINRIFKEPHSF